ncbi:MAG: hypothetical protein AABW73_02765 [Nanoarchaeota archaeon]
MKSKHALIINGPSGVGKSAISSLICKKYNYKHCDIDEFKLLFSQERSKERTKIGEKTGYFYAKELIRMGYNLVIEAIPDKYAEKLIPLLKKNNYKFSQIVLIAPLDQCIKNNKMRKRKSYNETVIRNLYKGLLLVKGDKVDISGKSINQAYNEIIKNYLA